MIRLTIDLFFEENKSYFLKTNKIVIIYYSIRIIINMRNNDSFNHRSIF